MKQGVISPYLDIACGQCKLSFVDMFKDVCDVVISHHEYDYSFLFEPVKYRVRPNAGDAARVIGVSVETVISHLLSTGAISHEDTCWMGDLSDLSLGERAVSSLMKLNRKKLKDYYRTASKSYGTMDVKEEKTFDAFVMKFTRRCRRTGRRTLDMAGIDKAFIRDLFRLQEPQSGYWMTRVECELLSTVRNSKYYHVTIKEDKAIISPSGQIKVMAVTYRAFRYHIFSAEPDSESRYPTTSIFIFS